MADGLRRGRHQIRSARPKRTKRRKEFNSDDKCAANQIKVRRAYIDWAGLAFAVTAWDSLNIEVDNAYAWTSTWDDSASTPYLTTNDGLLEFNLVNNYKMYENFDVNLELGYIANLWITTPGKRPAAALPPSRGRTYGKPR